MLPKSTLPSAVIMTTALLGSPALAADPSPPVAKKRPKVEVVHGEKRWDDYFWLRDKQDPEVAAYLEAENAYTAALMKPTAALQEALYTEMLDRIKETDENVPWKEGAFWYYSRTEAGKQYPIWCRKAGSLEAPEQVILDLNALAEGKPFMALGAFTVSDDGRYLAYSTDETGFRQYTLHVKDLQSGEVLADRVEKTVSVLWAADREKRRTLFYTVEDAAKRAYRLYRHDLGAKGADALVYEEKDELFRLGAGRTRSKAYLLLASSSHTTSEWRYLRADTPEGEWKVVAPRRHEHEYDVDHRGDLFYIRTNDRGRNFRLVTAPISDPREANWKELIAHRPEVAIEGVDPFAHHIVVLEREQGLPHLRVLDPKDGSSRQVEFPEPAYEAYPGTNAEFETTTFRYVYESLVTPRSTIDYDMAEDSYTLRKQQPVLGGYSAARYRSERVFAVAKDGTRVPVDLVYRSALYKGDGSNPAFLYGYGAYGFPLPITFSSDRLSLLDRGFVLAYAHVRGGGEMGKPWHDAGRMQHKMNTFTDFIACAEHLIAGKYTRADRLEIGGGSAGGLLMGAVVNLRPDLFRAVLSQVPFVDVVNTMLDASLPLTAGEWEEWGDPRKKDEYDVIRRYCPYSNLEAKAYPAMLVKTSFNDSQVMYWEPAKYVAKLRTLKTDRNPLLFQTNMAAGHGGASGRYDALRETAFDYAFLLAQVGITGPELPEADDEEREEHR
jgi:oligopeptidase B